MLIHIGSKNPAKVEGVKQAFGKHFDDFECVSIDVGSGVSTHPSSMQEIVDGAKKRAQEAYSSDCDFAVGLEGGMFEFPGTISGYLETNICVIYDGKEFFVGGAPLFEWPESWIKRIINGEEASHLLAQVEGQEDKVYDELGGVGRLSKGAMTRTEYIKVSVFMALAPIVGKKYYN